MKAQRKAEEVERSRKRDASLAASLLGVDLADADYVPPTTDRDDGADIAGGEGGLSEAEKKAIKGGSSLEEYSWELDADVDKLADLLVRKAADLPVSAQRPTLARAERRCAAGDDPNIS